MSKLAILGGEPTRKEPYPEWPVHDERDIEAVTRVVKSGNWGGYPYPGPETRRFLKMFAEMQGGGYPVAAANGTVTMEVALRAADIGWGDEVIVPAITFQATAAAPIAGTVFSKNSRRETSDTQDSSFLFTFFVTFASHTLKSQLPL